MSRIEFIDTRHVYAGYQLYCSLLILLGPTGPTALSAFDKAENHTHVRAHKPSQRLVVGACVCVIVLCRGLSGVPPRSWGSGINTAAMMRQ